MSRDADYLTKRGWLLVHQCKRGMVIQRYWQDPRSDRVLPQYLALLRQRRRDKAEMKS